MHIEIMNRCTLCFCGHEIQFLVYGFARNTSLICWTSFYTVLKFILKFILNYTRKGCQLLYHFGCPRISGTQTNNAPDRKHSPPL